jgi:hypothetical protein
MKTPSLVSLLILILFIGTSFDGFTQVMTTNGAPVQVSAPTPASPPATTPALAKTPAKMPVYHPPGVTGDVLPVRVGGGSRGGAANGVSVEVLVPDHVALTTQSQPSLYWYQSVPARTLCEVTLTEPKKAKPLLVLKSSTPTKAGIHAIRLTDYKVKLTPGVVYKWSVAVVVDPHNRSQDIIANGVIKYVEPSADLATKLAAADDSNRAADYAEAGIWYDALDALTNLIDKNPGDQALQDQRAQLLKQVGLNGASIEKTAFVK